MKILIVGGGSIGQRHAHNIETMRKGEIAFVEPDRQKQKQLRATFPRSQCFLTLGNALSPFVPDVVCVCNPTVDHVRTALRALQSGAHVFIEKPLSHRVSGIPTLIRMARAKRRVAMVACNYRFHGAFVAALRALKQKKYGTPVMASVTVGYFLPAARKGVNYRTTYAAGKTGGGVLLDSGSHVVDYLRALFGRAVFTKAWKSKRHPFGLPAEEIAQLFLLYASGVQAVVSLDYVRKRARHVCEIVTTRGTFLLDFKADRVTFADDSQLKVLYQGSGDSNAMYMREMKHFLSCIEQRTKPMQTLEMGRDVIGILHS